MTSTFTKERWEGYIVEHKVHHHEIIVRVQDHVHQFEMMINHPQLKCMRYLIDIAVDVLRKSAIFLHFVNHYLDPLKHIFEQQFLHRKDLCLFANAFHSIKIFTSKSQLKEAPLYNENDILTMYMLFSICSDFMMIGSPEPP